MIFSQSYLAYINYINYLTYPTSRTSHTSRIFNHILCMWDTLRSGRSGEVRGETTSQEYTTSQDFEKNQHIWGFSMTNLTNLPNLPAYKSDDYHWAVWCRYCGCLHFHGIGDGHRVAHCIIDTPYTQSGYTLVFAGELPAGAMTLHKVGYKRCWYRHYREGHKHPGQVLPVYDPSSVPEWGREL